MPRPAPKFLRLLDAVRRPTRDEAEHRLRRFKLDDEHLEFLRSMSRGDPVLAALSLQSSFYTSVYSASWSEGSLHQAVTLMLAGWNAYTLRSLVLHVGAMPQWMATASIVAHAAALVCVGASWWRNYQSFRHAIVDTDLLPGPIEVISFARARLAELPMYNDANNALARSSAEVAAIVDKLAPWISFMQHVNTRRLLALRACRQLELTAFACSIAHLPLWIHFSTLSP